MRWKVTYHAYAYSHKISEIILETNLFAYAYAWLFILLLRIFG